MAGGAAETFAVWHECVKAAVEGTAAPGWLRKKLAQHVSEGAKFSPPTYYSSYTGRDQLLLLLETATEVFGSSFRYHRQWLSDDGREWALEFTAEIANSGKKLKGIDLVSLDEEGHIASFEVLARPPNAVAVLKQEMGRRVPEKLAKLHSRI